MTYNDAYYVYYPIKFFFKSSIQKVITLLYSLGSLRKNIKKIGAKNISHSFFLMSHKNLNIYIGTREPFS